MQIHIFCVTAILNSRIRRETRRYTIQQVVFNLTCTAQRKKNVQTLSGAQKKLRLMSPINGRGKGTEKLDAQ